jgi:hypothetical protein
VEIKISFTKTGNQKMNKFMSTQQDEERKRQVDDGGRKIPNQIYKNQALSNVHKQKSNI